MLSNRQPHPLLAGKRTMNSGRDDASAFSCRRCLKSLAPYSSWKPTQKEEKERPREKMVNSLHMKEITSKYKAWTILAKEETFNKTYWKSPVKADLQEFLHAIHPSVTTHNTTLTEPNTIIQTTFGKGFPRWILVCKTSTLSPLQLWLRLLRQSLPWEVLLKRKKQ